jgi:hypothetical protein
MSIKLDEYTNKYQHAKLERRDGILQVTLHTNGKELEWGSGPHEELSYLFADIARDFQNKVVILTGTGESFCANPPLTGSANLKSSVWDRVYNEGKHLLMNHLNVEVPMIAAVNGPAHRHAELAVLCDIVLAAEHTTFQDSAHFLNGTVPGDGVHINCWAAGRTVLCGVRPLLSVDAARSHRHLNAVSRARCAQEWKLGSSLVALAPPGALHRARSEYKALGTQAARARGGRSSFRARSDGVAGELSSPCATRRSPGCGSATRCRP